MWFQEQEERKKAPAVNRDTYKNILCEDIINIDMPRGDVSTPVAPPKRRRNRR